MLCIHSDDSSDHSGDEEAGAIVVCTDKYIKQFAFAFEIHTPAHDIRFVRYSKISWDQSSCPPPIF
jgi:hypothetical protein